MIHSHIKEVKYACMIVFVTLLCIVPRAVENTSLDILSYTQDQVIIQFYIPVCY